MTPDQAVREAAAAAPDLQVLAGRVRGCRACPELVATRHQVVPGEVNCRGWTERQLALAAPRVVVALGLSATRWLLGPTSLAAVRGRLHGGSGYRVVPTYHPSAALRFGPHGEPRRLLRADLALAAEAAR